MTDFPEQVQNEARWLRHHATRLCSLLGDRPFGGLVGDDVLWVRGLLARLNIKDEQSERTGT